MRTLYLARHGKSSWKYPEMDDRERPLKGRGEKDAHMMGKILRGKGVTPGLILSSPANRAFDTAIIFAGELDYSVEKVVKKDSLYFGNMQQVLEVIKEDGDEFDDVFVFGHNPITLDLVNQFGNKLFENVPTSGVACVQFMVDSWKDITLENGSLRWLDYPSLHKD